MRYRRNWIRRVMALAVVCGVAGGMVWLSAGGAERKPEAGKPKPKPKGPPIGYDDTPFLPDGKWRVHDIKRPHPRVVEPGTASTQDKPGRPPADAVVLFDGKDLSKWASRGRGKDRNKTVPPQWKVENGYMEVTPKAGSIFTKEEFGDCQLHVEWAAPTQTAGKASQERGNSGVILMSCYEIQVLDSYENVTYADGQAASIYGQYPPLVNASRKPGEWQTYDIIFEAPRFEGDKLVKPAFVTVIHNGVVVHHRQRIIGRMSHRRVGTYAPHEPQAPLLLQAHGNPVRYRNIWIRRLTGYDEQ
jgi:hypothetical protein